jgi:hypothetical protein
VPYVSSQFLVKRWQPGKRRQQAPLPDGLDHQASILLADDCLIAIQLEFPWDAHGLIAPVSEQLYMAFSAHLVSPAKAYACTYACHRGLSMGCVAWISADMS